MRNESSPTSATRRDGKTSSACEGAGWVWILIGACVVFFGAVITGSTVFVTKNPRLFWGSDSGNPVATKLEGWLDNGGDLIAIIDDLGDQAVADDNRDVRAMEAVLKKLMAEPGNAPEIGRVATLIIDSESIWPQVQYDEYVDPVIHAWIRKVASEDEASEEETDAVFDCLEASAWNYTEGVGKRIARLANDGFAQESDRWWGLFEQLVPGETTLEKMMAEFTRELPPGNACRALLYRANDLKLNEEWDGKHPFDTPAGAAVLKTWLSGEDDSSYTAATALALVSEEIRAELLPLGLVHPDPSVQLEAAWAELEGAGDDPDPAALARLVKGCLNLAESRLSVSLLEETGYGDAVPEAAREPGFIAKAEMVESLIQPNELGEMPLSISEYDSRTLVWPPDAEDGVMPDPAPVYLFAFTYPDKDATATGYGFVSSTGPWVSFTRYDSPPPAETLYAEQCALEFSWEQEDENAPAMTREEAYDLLKLHNPKGL